MAPTTDSDEEPRPPTSKARSVVVHITEVDAIPRNVFLDYQPPLEPPIGVMISRAEREAWGLIDGDR